MKDELLNTLIEPNFYSVLKEYGMSTERFRDGKYKDVMSHAMWIAYLCGKEQKHAQQVMGDYPDDDEEPHET